MSDKTKTTKTIDELKTEVEAAQRAYEEAQKQLKALEAEEKARKKKELELRKEDRLKEIVAKEKELARLVKEYINDYGSLKLVNCDDDWFGQFLGGRMFL